MHHATNKTTYGSRTPALVGSSLLLYLLVGCVAPGSHPTDPDRLVVEAARPLLALDPDAAWTDAYNQLVELGPASLAYLMNRPAMMQAAAPDDLAVLLHTSLIRTLADPQTNPPRLSATCFETTLDLLHFDLKVNGAPLGTVAIFERGVPRAWPDLYPADFDQRRAARIDLEADRQGLQRWWLAHRATPEALVTQRRLQPQPAALWRLLARRYADRWQYQPERRAVLCSSPQEPTLLNLPTTDYNLVRAACIWLGTCPAVEVESHLIELLAAPSTVVAHNARFALDYSHDEGVQAVLRRHPRD
jgi:hypothetical protein